MNINVVIIPLVLILILVGLITLPGVITYFVENSPFWEHISANIGLWGIVVALGCILAFVFFVNGRG